VADNVAVSAAASYTVASDDDGTAQHQMVKLEYGADGEFNRVTADTPIPVLDVATIQVLRELIEHAAVLSAVRGVAGLLVSINGGTLPTVTTVTNLAQEGGFAAQPIVPATSNMAAVLSNINNVIVS
jgi:hypothetical protein